MNPPSDDHTPASERLAAAQSALGALTVALEDPDIDLDAQLTLLLEPLTAAVPSLLTASLTLTVDGRAFTLAAPLHEDATAATGSSLRIPLSTVTARDSSTAQLLVRAASPGALVDLAADCAHLLGVDLRVMELNIHLHSDPVGRPRGEGVSDGMNFERSAASATFADHAVIDYAVGILFERGALLTIADATAALRALAERDGTTLHDTARRIVTNATSTPPNRPACQGH